MERVTKQDLEQAVRLLNIITSEDYSLGWAYGGVRVERANESVDVTRRGTKREVYAMLLGMLHVAGRLRPRALKLPKFASTTRDWRQS